MIVGQAIDTVGRNNVFEALIVEGKSVYNRFGQNDGGRPFYCLAIDDALS